MCARPLDSYLRPMATQDRRPSPKTVWTYGYQIIPPQAVDRLATITNLLDNEHLDARRGERTWVGRVVTEQQVTHILVVSDSPEQNRDVNRRLEAELEQLQVDFSITAPMAVTDGPEPQNG
jgi:hypothetical protein